VSSNQIVTLSRILLCVKSRKTHVESRVHLA